MNSELNSKIIIIGAGISGILMATYLKNVLNFSDFIIIESKEEIGGTWLANKYPGVACDSESVLYSLYTNPNPNWSVNFAGQEEILNYWLNLVKVYDLRRQILFNSTVKSAKFNVESSKWILQVNNQKDDLNYTLECDILIGAVGYLRIPNIPKIFTNFKGPMMHSAQWDSKIELEDKVVGIVGSGASAVQVIPNIIDKVKELQVFQRNPPFVIPRFKSKYSVIYRLLLNWIPGLAFLAYWLVLLCDDLLLYNAFKINTLTSRLLLFLVKKFIDYSISDPIKRDLMVPKYTPGCKRVTPSDDYYKAIDSPKLLINDGNIDNIESTTIHSRNGSSRKVDVLILATGFKTNSPYQQIDITNLNGDHLDKAFITPGVMPSTKFGITHAKMPNFFQLLGHSTNLGYSSSLRNVECQANYIVKLIQLMNLNNIKTVELKEEIGIEYWKWVQVKMMSTAWSSNCSSWYKNESGEVISNWPSTGLKYYFKTFSPNLRDYHCEYN